MLRINEEIRSRLRRDLKRGDHAEIRSRLLARGVEVSQSVMSQFITGVRPYSAIGEAIVREAEQLLALRVEGNREVATALQAIGR